MLAERGREGAATVEKVPSGEECCMVTVDVVTCPAVICGACGSMYRVADVESGSFVGLILHHSWMW